MISLQKRQSNFQNWEHFSLEKATLRSKKRLAAINKEKCEEHPRRYQGQNSSVARSQKDYITQVSEEIESRVTKKLSQELSRMEKRILGALAHLDNIFMNPLIHGRSGTSLETSQNAFGKNQGTNEDESQSDPHTEAGIFRSHTTENSGPEVGHDSSSFFYATRSYNGHNDDELFLYSNGLSSFHILAEKRRFVSSPLQVTNCQFSPLTIKSRGEKCEYGHREF